VASVDRGRYGLGMEPRKNQHRSADVVDRCGRQHRSYRHREIGLGFAWSQTPCTYRNFLRGSREIPLLALTCCQGPCGQEMRYSHDER